MANPRGERIERLAKLICGKRVETLGGGLGDSPPYLELDMLALSAM